MNIELIVSPLIGGIIGLVTNNIAIKMLFKPYTEIYLGKIRLPFTPGLIPKERPRIARAIGQVVGNELLDVGTMKDALCSEKVHDIFEEKFQECMKDYTKDETSLSQYAEKKKLKNRMDGLESQLSELAGEYVTKELLERRISEQLLDAAMEEISNRLNPLLLTMASGAINAAKEPLARRLDEMIKENCPAIVNEYIDMKYDEVLKTQVRDVAYGVDKKMPDLSHIIWRAYTSVVQEKAQSFLGAIDIAKIVEDKINEYNIEDFEKLLLDICHKELRAVVWIGGLLGMLLGFINLLF